MTKRFGPAQNGRRAEAPATLEAVDLTLRAGEFVALIGASGCGKTTLLRLLAGLEEPTQGSVRIFGRTAAEACRRREIGVAFQQPALVPSRTALENVRLTLRIVGRSGGDGTKPADPTELLTRFGLGRFLHHYPHQLSGGMRQRVNIACALVHSPRLLLLDEPFGALDELTRESLMDWLADILQQSGQTALLVTHNIEEAVCLSDRVAILGQRPGRIAQIVPISLPRPRAEACRSTPEFLRLSAEMRRTLRQVIQASEAADPPTGHPAGEITGVRVIEDHPLENECLAEPVTRAA